MLCPVCGWKARKGATVCAGCLADLPTDARIQQAERVRRFRERIQELAKPVGILGFALGVQTRAW